MYEQFAQFYDRLGWDTYAKELWPDFKSYLDKIGFKPQTLLDIACGTGALCICASKGGIIAEGLDISDEMLKKAGANAKENGVEINLYHRDMSNFNLYKKYDLVTCTFDAINHMIDFQKWLSMFKCVKEHLNDGGLFMFDMNTLKDLKENWNNIHIKKYPAGDYHISKSISFGDMACVTFTAFVKKDDLLFEGYEETVREVSFPLDDIKNVLLNLDFKDIKIMDRRFIEVDNIDMLTRAFIIATK
ncbi:class I SAM-dependent methyltransferase [Thermoanaerobacterium sp. RBIITD]|uniref:class I SAM-dependent DNA methyltransferase n=1 Tax=Thermoanaerobacterium sp. RBIITD TaxID=1550240 RepID=UPI000BB8BD95|nr:class I SAM-dependent methyltransferase [Thermoanaerobacterium sp. RBIITD]SNX53281.1 Methyltransferase domain-containing protein [Thermoanaerobacterium sp. RBIITD]